MCEGTTEEGAPTFEVAAHDHGSTRMLVVRGELDMAYRAALEEAVDVALILPPGRLVIDFSETAFIDSTGVHCLRHAARSAHQQQVRFEVRPARREIHRMFELTGTVLEFPFLSVEGGDGGST